MSDKKIEWYPVDGAITSRDLTEIKDDCAACGIAVESTRFRVDGSGETCEVIYVNGQVAVVTGADAVHVDADSLADGIDRVLSGEVAP